MALNFAEKKSVKKDFGRVDDGAYPARIVQIVDFGLQYATDWKTGEVKKYDDGNDVMQHKVWINFELPDETIEIDGVARPRWYGKEYTVSAHEKSALHALLKAVDPKGDNTDKGRNVRGLLGLPAMVTIASTSSGKPKIGAVSGVPKGLQVGALANDEAFLDLDSVDTDSFFELPAWMQKRIKEGIGFDDTKMAKALASCGNVDASKPSLKAVEDLDVSGY